MYTQNTRLNSVNFKLALTMVENRKELNA